LGYGAAAAVTLEGYMAVSPYRAPDVLEIDEALTRLAEVARSGVGNMRRMCG
jgi:hypothetical protein